MKLDFEINSSAHSSADSDFTAENADFTGDSTGVSEKLSAGIKAAQEGRRGEAKILLLQVAEAEPENESTWLWLASISEYPEELLVFLDNVLSVNPNNERALQWAKATKSLLSKTFAQRGIDAAKESRDGFAKQCFLQAIAHEHENETAWLWLASVSDSIEEKNACLEKVLLLNPENETALSSHQSIKKQMAQSHLPRAAAEAFAGETESALRTLDEILNQSPEMEDALLLKSCLITSLDEKIDCFEKVLEFNPENELAQAGAAFLHSLTAKLNAENAPPEIENTGQIFDASEVENDEISVRRAEEDALDSDLIGESNLIGENNAENSAELNEDEILAVESYFVEEFSEDDNLLEQSEFDQESTPETKDEFEAETENNFEAKEEIGGETSENIRAETQFDSVQPEENTAPEFGAENKADEEIDAEMNFAGDEPEANENLDKADDETETDENLRKDENLDKDNDENLDKDEETFAASELETAVSDADISDEIAKIYAEYSVEEPENAADTEDFEISPVEDDLPSYYEIEEGVLPSDLAKIDYSADAEDSEQDSLAVNRAAEEFPADDEEFSLLEEEEEEEEAQEIVVETSHEQSEVFACPFCSAENEAQAFVCQSCQAMLSLSDLEMLLAHRDGNCEIVRRAVELMEAEKNQRDFSADELKFLGVGQINLKHFRRGFDSLQQAVKSNPNDVVLGSQVNALAIRLAEIEQQESIQDTMPKNKTILIVDDSATVRKLISGKLEKCGHEVLCAVDGMEALEKINEIVPDLILLDINMPRMDGYQVCKLIRGNEKTRDVPIVMISGKDGFFDKVRGRMAGTTGYITKPFGPETLMKTVENYIVQNGAAN